MALNILIAENNPLHQKCLLVHHFMKFASFERSFIDISLTLIPIFIKGL